MNIIQSQDKRLPPLELEKLYKTIHLDNDAYKILDLALERNFGGLLPDKTSMGVDYNESVFKKVSESLEDLLLVGLYAKHIENSCRTESALPLLKQLGYVTERLIRKFRQQGVIFHELHMETD